MRRTALVLAILGALILAVALVSWAAFPAWRQTPGGFWIVLAAAATGVVALIKGVLDILQRLQELSEEEKADSVKPDMTEVDPIMPAPQVSESPTASELRRFLDEDFPRLENALHDVWVSISGGSPLDRWSAPSNWNSIFSRFTDPPERTHALFNEIVETRQLAWGGTARLTRGQLSSARQGINQLLRFLHQRFPAAGVELPSPGMQIAAPEESSEQVLVDDRKAVRRALTMARRALAILEEQAAGYTALTIPAHVRIELEEKRKEVSDLEARLRELEE